MCASRPHRPPVPPAEWRGDRGTAPRAHVSSDSMDARSRTAGRFPIGAAASLGVLEEDPHALLARLRAREPVSWLPALDGWLVTRRDLALEVMRDPKSFTVDDPRCPTGQ